MDANHQHDFVVVANRLPVDRFPTESGYAWRASPGGLAPALAPIVTERHGAWVGWAGDVEEPPEPFEHRGMALWPIGLSEQEFTDYYVGSCNSTMWPLYHDAVEQPVFSRRWHEVYRQVNTRFAAAAAEVAAAGATVWVQDYHLQLVPALLRELRPDLRIGFFLHIPFPPLELYMQMPQRVEILRGLLGADLVGFQQRLATRNFVQLSHNLLGLRYQDQVIKVDDRTVKAIACPISIDVRQIEDLAANPAVQARAEEIRAQLGHPETIILGIDRLDYTKGIELRLKAYEELLADGMLVAPDAVMVQVAMPSRERVEHYQKLRVRVERRVSAINGRFGHVGMPAVHYLNEAYDLHELVALYCAADVMMVTPLRDGMNLVAKAYVMARGDTGGALVLSEFAGSASELRQAFLCNPHDLDGVKSALLRAVRADQTDARRRMRAMQRHLRDHDVRSWAEIFLRELELLAPP